MSYHLERGKWLLSAWEDWSQFFKGSWNWYDFTLVNLRVENDKLMGGYEIEAALLGVGLRVRYNHTETEAVREIRERVKNLREEMEIHDERR